MYNMKSNLRNLCIVSMLFLLTQLGLAQAGSFSFSLEEAQKHAVDNSYTSQTSRKEVEKSQRKVKETTAIGLPQINGSASYQQYLETPIQLIPGEAIGQPNQEFVEVFFGTEQQMSVGARVDQLIFDGSYFVGLQAVKVFLELSKNDLEKTEIDIRSMVTEAYGNVLVAEENVRILKGNIESLEQSAFETEQFFKNGFVEEQDKDQIELTLASVRNTHDQAVRLIEIARNQLKFILGIDITAALNLTDDLTTVTTAFSSKDYLNKDFNVSSHIDYKIIDTRLQATKLQWKQQKSTYLPSLSAFYSYQRNSFANEFEFFGDADWFPTQLIGVNLNVPIFSSFSRSNKVQQAKIDFEQVSIAKKQVEQQLMINAQNARSQYTFALSQFNTTKQNVELAERIYNRTKIKYDEGISTSLDLTQANNQLLTNQGNYIDAAFQLISAKSNLDKALNQK